MNALFSMITSRLTWSFLGILIISILIWFYGPIVMVGSVAPFASVFARVATIFLLFFIWILAALVPKLYRIWLDKKLANQLSSSMNSTINAKENKAPNEQYSTLSERFSDAVRLLKRAYFSGLQGKKKPSWRGRFSRQYVYQLPWYLVIGAPSSGKTTVLSNSGLNFPLLDYFGKADLYSIRDMNSCNWWFTNDAVLLDTAGRYTIQDKSSSRLDKKEWQVFIKLLKKYRPRQPLNGVIITVSVEDLLNSSAESRDKQAYMIRRRLYELHERLKIQFPIYVLLTKTDLLKGFTAYFTNVDKAAREQIWGFTFPQDKRNDLGIQTIFEEQYSQLQQRLDLELPHILLNESDPRQCAESYLFPQEFAALRPQIRQYLEIVFTRSGFKIPFYPRGIYFTSGTQKGVSIDQVMEKLNRQFQLPTNNDSASMSWGMGRREDDERDLPIAPTTQQTYFLKKLLESIFQEAGLATNNRWWVYQNRLINWLGYLVLVGAMTSAIILFFTSYANNKDYLKDVGAKFPVIKTQGEALSKTNDDNTLNDIYDLLPILNSLSSLAESDNFPLNDPPISYRMGLYTGKKISSASDVLYNKALEKLLLPQVVKLIIRELRNGNNKDTEKTYDALKAYQMLYQPDHYDARYLHNWVMQDIRSRTEQKATQLQLQQIDNHLSQLLINKPVTSPYLRDDNLVKQKQALISSIPPEQRAYNALKQSLRNDLNLTPVDLISLAGPDAEAIFSLADGAAITSSIPGMFTPAAYQKSLGKNLVTFITGRHTQDKWVLGSQVEQPAISNIELSVRQFYIDDYIHYWDSFLADIRLNHIDGLEERTRTARLLSGPDSPLRILLMNISKNVTITNPLDSLMQQGKTLQQIKTMAGTAMPQGRAGQLASKLAQNDLLKTDLLKNALSDNEQPSPEQTLADHFAPITDWVKKSQKGKDSGVPFDEVLKMIGGLYQYLTTVKDTINTDGKLPSNEIIMQLQAESARLPIPFREMVSSLAINASSDTQLSDMKRVSQHFTSEISDFCYQAIANRYPLTNAAEQDIKTDDIARMFAPEKGLMTAFFQKNLAGKVDTTQPKWQFMPGVNGKPLPGGEKLLVPFQQAEIISNTLFANSSPMPSFRVTVSPIEMSNKILSMELNIDGQRIQYSHGPQFSQLVNWPGTAGSNQVRLQLNLEDGTTASLATSGPWALNRFVDLAMLNHHNSQNEDMSVQAMFHIKNYTVLLKFTPNSVYSPFKLPNFTCPNPMSMKTS
ncbi:MAG: type VI secretion system membrane subunit TssM [Enterobacteriaceae bacterium]|jgi:type VI secretion system protein ImpL|nr:type VI secretion system membrane subunit TssM [Enterobacteriaceae bacterium]